jgi:hypothetical protein
VGFDDLQAFVHEGRGVDGDLLSHLPVGVPQRLLGCDEREGGRGARPKGSARGREDEALDVLINKTGVVGR